MPQVQIWLQVNPVWSFTLEMKLYNNDLILILTFMFEMVFFHFIATEGIIVVVFYNFCPL